MGLHYRALAVDEARLASLQQSPIETDMVLSSGIDLGKYWAAVQILLAGRLESEEPLMTGSEFGGDLGDQVVRVASPADVKRVAAGFAQLTLEGLRGSVDVAAFADVYPYSWDEDELEAWRVANAAHELVLLYRKAADGDQCVLAAVG
jgi:hypothetical protein